MTGRWEGPDVDPQHFSAGSELYPYSLNRSGEEKSYDHRYDPYEWFNLAGNPGFSGVKRDLNNKLVSLTGIH